VSWVPARLLMAAEGESSRGRDSNRARLHRATLCRLSRGVGQGEGGGVPDQRVRGAAQPGGDEERGGGLGLGTGEAEKQREPLGHQDRRLEGQARGRGGQGAAGSGSSTARARWDPGGRPPAMPGRQRARALALALGTWNRLEKQGWSRRVGFLFKLFDPTSQS
jgi:hypothetical protein